MASAQRTGYSDVPQPQPELELDELYRELILDHYKSPRHHTKLARADVVAEGYNPVCGDEVDHIAMTIAFGGEAPPGVAFEVDDELARMGAAVDRARTDELVSARFERREQTVVLQHGRERDARSDGLEREVLGHARLLVDR